MPTLHLNDLPFLGGGLTPLDFGKPEGWWKADSFALADGTAIGDVGKEWIDEMGDVNHYGRQTTSSLQPIFHTNVSGSKPAILFTWKNDFSIQHYLDASNGSEGNSIIPADDYTVISVVQPSSLSVTTAGAIIGQAYAGNNCTLICQANTQTSLGAYDALHSNQSATFANQLDITGMYSYVRSGGNMSYYLDTTNVTNGVPGAINQGRFNFIGAASAPNADARWGGYIMELVIWSKALTSANITALYRGYFRPRWVTLPSV